MLFFMWRLWRNPPSRRKLIVMLVAFGLSFGLVIVERTVGWPDWLKTERAPRQRLPSIH
ncbi:hypothetical protein [Roseomonas sp. WA12]